MLFCKKSQKRCSFLLTSEEKEPKKTATPKPLHRGFNLFRGKTLYIKDLVWLAKPVPYRASHILLNGALPHIYLIPCLNTEGFRGEQPLRDIIIPPHELCGGSINERDMKPMLSKFYFLLLSIQLSILKPGMRLKCFTLSVTRMRSSCSAVAPIIRSMLSMRCPARSSCQRMSPYSRMQ